MDNASLSTDVKSSSSNKEYFTAQDLQHVLYGRNPVKIVHYETISESRLDSTGSDCYQADHDSKMSTPGPTNDDTTAVATETGYTNSARANVKLTYAVASFPDEVKLCVSGIPGAGYGVCAKQHIPVGTWIGPYEGKRIAIGDVTPDMDTSFMWEIYEDGKLAHCLDGSDQSSSSWMRFIRCARHRQEQNMIAFQHDASIFYRAFREIPCGTELLVWYDDSYLQHVGIPLGGYVTQNLPGKSPSVKQPVIVRVPRAVRAVGERDIPLDAGVTSQANRQQEHRPSTQTVYSLLPRESCRRIVEESLAKETRPIKRFRMQPEINNSSALGHNVTKPITGIQESTGYRRIYDKVLGNNEESDEFKCGQCKMSFTQRSILNNHLCSRMPCKPYRCGHCQESFAQPKELRMHAIVHVSEKPFKCGYCLRSFSGATTLNNHVRMHTGEKPFLCERCGKSFSQASQLSRHRRICVEHVD